MHKGLELELNGTIAHLDDLSRSAALNQRVVSEMELRFEQREALRQAIRQMKGVPSTSLHSLQGTMNRVGARNARKIGWFSLHFMEQ